MKLALLILSLLTVSTVSVVLCEQNRLEFFSHYSLGRQDELNRTFTSISKNITFPEVIYNSSAQDTYRVGDYNITWRYIDTNQKANTSGHDTVIVWGGHLRVDVNFNWKLTGSASRSGNGSATGYSDVLDFEKKLTVDQKSGYVMWDLVNHTTISFDEYKFNVTRLNPYTEDDFNVVKNMMNHLLNNSGFADNFIKGVNTLLDIHLNESLHEEHFQRERFTNYTYAHPVKGNITVPYDIVIKKAAIGSTGLHILSSDVIVGYSNFSCGNPIPSEELDGHGGLQTLLAMDFVRSTASWALDNNVFDTDLNPQTWESRHFQFYAGDLYDVIPNLQKKFYPDQKLNGNCKAKQQGFSIVRGSDEYFNVSLNYNCALNADKSGKILDFDVDSHFNIRGVANAGHIDLIVSHAEFNASYYRTGEYSVENVELANYYLNSTSWSVRGTKTFGSNFSVIARDYPHFEIHKNDFVIIYDSSQQATGRASLLTE